MSILDNLPDAYIFAFRKECRKDWCTQNRSRIYECCILRKLDGSGKQT